MEKILVFLQKEMVEPTAYGWFHLLWICASIIILSLLLINNNKSETKQRVILFVYGFISIALELAKQLIWTFTYDSSADIIVKDYQWYAAPLQFCSTPMYAALICSAIKPGHFRDMLLSYLSYVSILGGLLTILIPDSCLTSDVLVNIHTMWLHCGGFVISSYLLITHAVKCEKRNLINSFAVFLFFVIIALSVNIGIYQSGILNGETFNMFYISPYFTSELPIFNVIQQNVPYVIFLITYVVAVCIGASLVYFTTRFMNKLPTYYANILTRIKHE